MLCKANDLVIIKDLLVEQGINKKISSKYKGPYLNKVLRKNRYVVTDVPSYPFSNKSYNSLLSTDKIKP